MILTLATRFLKLDWGNHLFFHPDENNMANAVARLSLTNLNPEFYAYGQFPLYLSFFTSRLFRIPLNFPNAIYILRFYSGLFGSFSVFLVYLISQKLFRPRFVVIISTLLAIFCPVLIQFSHFGTTESFLIFVFLLNLFSAQTLLDKPTLIPVIASAVVSGFGLGSKITALLLMTPVFFSLILSLRRKLELVKFMLYNFLFIYLSLVVFLIVSPYSFINFSSFLSSMNYETSVAIGTTKVFYTNQFLPSTPYLFQIRKIFPYVLGLPVSVFAILGIIRLLFLRQNLRRWLIILFPSLIFFLYNGQLYTKWTRFLAPIYFVFPLLTAYFISGFKNKYLTTLLILLSLFPGICFLNLYLRPDVRLLASQWIEKNIPPNSTILSEAGNVIDIPISSTPYQLTHLDFYNIDTNHEISDKLVPLIFHADYIIVPSRRAFKNQSGPQFPVSNNYYQSLFSGRLGFTQIKKITVFTDPFLDPENAEETWTVFDRPIIRIFKKTRQLSHQDIQSLIHHEI